MLTWRLCPGEGPYGEQGNSQGLGRREVASVDHLVGQ